MWNRRPHKSYVSIQSPTPKRVQASCVNDTSSLALKYLRCLAALQNYQTVPEPLLSSRGPRRLQKLSTPDADFFNFASLMQLPAHCHRGFSFAVLACDHTAAHCPARTGRVKSGTPNTGSSQNSTCWALEPGSGRKLWSPEALPGSSTCRPLHS